MTKMVDRVAQAICAESATLDWREYRDEARRAIAAMREPTEAMLAAGVSWTVRMSGDQSANVVRTVYQAMVDAALKE
jgi:hypothetical protein